MVAQLSVRVDPQLRQRVNDAARRRGTTVQRFVVEAVERALASAEDASMQEARRRLATAVEAGAYREYVDSIDDPELRTE